MARPASCLGCSRTAAGAGLSPPGPGSSITHHFLHSNNPTVFRRSGGLVKVIKLVKVTGTDT